MSEKAVPYMGSEPYAFVSYSHKDSETVYKMIGRLAEMGCRIWYDEGIEAADDYGSTLYNRIKDCSVFIIFKSRNSTASQDVRKEIHHAINFNKTILQVVLDADAKYPPDIAYHVLPTWQFISVNTEPDVYYRKLCRGLRNCGASAPAIPAPDTDRLSDDRLTNERQTDDGTDTGEDPFMLLLARIENAAGRMIKRPFTLAAVTALIAAAVWIWMGNFALQSGELYGYKASGGTATLTHYYGDKSCPELPSVIYGREVTALENTFADNKTVRSVNIPDSVTSIGNYAFQGCTGLVSVAMPEKAGLIGSGAFKGCSGLESVTIPDGVTDIGNSAFDGCTGLVAVTVPGSVKTVGRFAFYDCYSLESVVMREGVEKIGEAAFVLGDGHDSSPLNISLPESVQEIGRLAFENRDVRVTSAYDAEYYTGPDTDPFGYYCGRRGSLMWNGKKLS